MLVFSRHIHRKFSLGEAILIVGTGNCSVNGKLAKLESSNQKSGRGVEV